LLTTKTQRHKCFGVNPSVETVSIGTLAIE
jgi:hypothetical protein